MKEIRVRTAILGILACLLLSMPLLQAQQYESTHAVEAGRIAPLQRYQYAVKFICGRCRGEILSPGAYLTAINVHNPYPREVKFQKTFSVALPGQRMGPVTGPADCHLQPNHSFEIDCGDILQHLGTRQEFNKGFVVIETMTPLDVVAVYTAGGTREEVRTLHTERVPPRKIRIPGENCADLIVEKIEKPQWDGDNDRSVINAVIKNIGSASASATIARIIDYSTLQPTGAPENAIANTPPLAPGASVTVTFHLSYWVYNPDAELEVTADYKGMLQECDETNNVKNYFDPG